MMDERVGDRLYGPNPKCYCGAYLEINRGALDKKARWQCTNCHSAFKVLGVDYDD